MSTRSPALTVTRQSERREPLEDGRGERIIQTTQHLFGGVDLGFEPKPVPDDGETCSIAKSVLHVLHDGFHGGFVLWSWLA